MLRVAAVVGLFAAGVGVMGLLFRWMTGELHNERQARRRRRAEQPPPVAPPEVRSAPRRPAAGHHPVGRRVPAAVAPVAAPPPPVRPRRPLELVAADLRRLAHELAMVPGGMPMARRRGLLAAFDDVLVEAAVLLEVPNQLAAEPPATRELERMRLLAGLEAAGLVMAD